MENSKTVGIWIRVSTDFQVKDESPEHHEKRARMYAESKGWAVMEVYRLDAVSGKSVMENSETKRMLTDIKNNKISGLIFTKLARLARNTKQLLEFAEIFKVHNADLISLAENIDTSTSAGRLFYTMIAAMAQWEREEIADRVAASVPIRAQLGKPLGGQASLGYQWVENEPGSTQKQLIINENEAPVRKLIYDLFLQHRRKTTVASTLNKQGYRTRNGSQFSDTTVDRLLRDPMAKGVRRANYTKSLGEDKKWVIKPESEWILTPCPPIVTEELWNECNRILEVQSQKHQKPVKKAVHLFTGILLCDCGSKMHVSSKSIKYSCQKCGMNKIDKGDLEEIYYQHLKSFLLSDGHLDSFLAKADSIIQTKESQLLKLNDDKKRITVDLDKLVQLYMSGEIPKEGIGRYYKPLEEQLNQIQESVPELQGEIDFLKVEYLNGDQVFHEAQNLYDKWPTLSGEIKRSIVEQITQAIHISKDQIKIQFSYSPSRFENPPDSQHNLMDSWKKPA